MPLSRRQLLATTGLAVPALALTTSSLCLAAPSPADLSTPAGWLTWADAHRDQLSLTVDDGRGAHLHHHPHRQRPLASAGKAVHLTAYATAVAEGRLHPDEQVRVGDWERFYVPVDGGAHSAALQHLGIPTDPTGLYAADPEHLVALEQLVDAMIRFSDSAVPDLLRARLGHHALLSAARRGGWHTADIRSFCAEYLFLVLPEHAPPHGTPVPVRRALGDGLERHYSTAPRLRRRVLDQLMQHPLPSYPEQCTWGSGTSSATASSLAALHRTLATAPSKPGGAAEIAREHLERPLEDSLPPGVLGIGYKGGSLPGVLTAGLSVRRTDGSTGSGALLAHGGISPDQLLHGDPGLPLLLAIENPDWRARLAHALRG